MANTNKRITVSDLDFDTIKTNLKTFLQGQSEFSDYDFEGSGLSVLLDILAYNTHYNGIYTNLAVNEVFLDSASKRSSVVSLAKMLGYVPRSAKCAEAVVNATITAPNSNPVTVTLPANQPFNTSINGESYTFYNKSAVTISRNISGNYIFPNLSIIEGTPLQFKYTAANGIRYIVPNPNVDLDTLTVRVQENANSDLFEVFTRAESLTDINELTKVYFIKEIDDGLYEIVFGQGIFGKQLNVGNVVTLDYYVSSLEAPNTSNVFSYGGVSLIGSNLSVATVERASGGSVVEDINSIKFNAPKIYAAQNRVVTPDDYRSIILSNFAPAQAVSVWGGEVNSPPIFGKTYICIKPKDAVKLTNLQKEDVYSILKPKNIVSIFPEIIDPEYLNVKVTSYVYYNPRETIKTASQIETIVKDAIMTYNDNELERFDSMLRFSKLTRIIDSADPSIINNTTRVIIKREFEPNYNVSAEYRLTLISPISEDGGNQGDVFSTTGFFIPNKTEVHYLDDDSLGNIRLYYLNSNFDKIIVNPTIGVIDYKAGTVIVNNLNITSLAGSVFEMQIKPESNDIVSALNQIVTIPADLLTVEAIADNSVNGDLQAGYNYKFQSIRS
jgi:hypothetical protein